jgi:hypothetical protein
MTNLKQGDLVIDYEGDLTLIVRNSDNILFPVCLTSHAGCADGNRPYYFSTIHKTIMEFLAKHEELGRECRVVGNIQDALVKLRNELPK